MDNSMIVNSIKNLCKNNNITVSQLEKEIGLSQGLVSKWMNTTPSLDKIVDIADYFHVSLDEVVGYDHSLNDDFIKELYERTGNGSVSWDLVTKTTSADYPQIKLYDPMEDEYPPQFYNEETYGLKHYVTQYNNGYIIIFAFHEYSSILKPNILKLFIQPTINSFLVEQKYNQDTLLKLWIKVLNSLGDNAPDAVKAEDLKNEFLTNSSLTNSTANVSKKTNMSDIKKAFNDPAILKLLETCNTPEFQQLHKTFSDPEFKAAIQVANKMQKYFENINK